MRDHDLSEIYRDQEAAFLQRIEKDRQLKLARLRDRRPQEASDPGAYLDLADALGEDPRALDVLREGIAHCQPNVDLYKDAIVALWRSNRTEEALEVIRRAQAVFPEAPFLKFGEALILPILYDTPEQLKYYRERFSAGLERLIASVRLDSPEARESALEAISWRTNFYLGYQGQDDRELQQQYGQLVHRIMAANYPQWAQPLTMPPLSDQGKIRVGYVSERFWKHSGSRLHLGWLIERDRNKFEMSAYHVGGPVDAATDEVRRVSDHFYHFPNELERTCEAIRADNLHVVVFVDIGMGPLMTKLAALRLAPIQCATWGHPVTTGLPTVDHFLSNQLMEPEDGENHYSERLIRLPGIGVCFRKPIIPRALLTKPRHHFGLREDRTVYWCGQSPFKYLPQHDDLFVGIAKRLPAAQFAFVAWRTSVREDFGRRLERAFAAQGIRAEDHCVTLPLQNIIDYWNHLAVSDIFLDSLEFSGGNTTLDAIASGLPVVTLPGRFMRGRQSYGILTQLGVTETIACDKEEYVNIAVRLAQDRAWRAQIVKAMKANEGQLFSRTECVRALEDFFLSVVQERLRQSGDRVIG